MKARIPLMIQDRMTSRMKGLKPTEGFIPDLEEFYLDGPVSRQVAVLDFDPLTGELLPGARYVAPPAGVEEGWYENEAGANIRWATREELYQPGFVQVSVFATVLKTIYLFVKRDTLGRPLIWAFDGPQLLVVPRAGKRANAYYHRDSRSLQFFYFPSSQDEDVMIYSCLSRDIVAHEAGHAIIDGIAPDLLDACTPQSLAIHEALADLTAVLMAFSSHTLRKYILKEEDGSIIAPTAFSTIAEEFAAARGHRHGLRSLVNQSNLKEGSDDCVRRDEPHDLSTVLSGALYSVMIKIHEGLKDEYAKKPSYANRSNPLYSASGFALVDGAERLKRMAFRALDYLPPGEVSYADYGRALIEVDRVAYPDDDRMRNWVRTEFVSRHIVPNEASFRVGTDFRSQGPGPVDVPTLHDSDWAAYEFANDKRDLLQIPGGVPFQVRPRLRVRKRYQHERTGEECIFKVAWDHPEGNPIGHGAPDQRWITVGTTLVLDWNTGRVLTLLSSAPPTKEREEDEGPDIHARRMEEYKKQRKDRDELLGRLAEEGTLKLGKDALGPDGQALLSAIQGELVRGAMKTRGTAKMLHIVGGE